MIPNTTPSPRKAALIIAAFIALFGLLATCHHLVNDPAFRPVEEQLNDTIFQDHSKIPDSL